MERLTKRQKNGDAMWNRGPDISHPGYTLGRICEKLCRYEDAEEQGRLLISEREIDDWLYAIVHDDIFNCYDISEHRITDICLSGTIITDGPAGDDMAEVWTMEMQKEYHVCFSLEEAEAKRQELEDSATIEDDGNLYGFPESGNIIRPATEEEKRQYDDYLREMKEKLKEQEEEDHA